MGRSLDIAVAGCGPAGLSAALFLKRDGHRVTLFERFDAPRPLGSGLMIQPTGLAILDRLGLGGVRAIGSRIDRLVGRASPSGRTVLDVAYAALGESAGHGVGIHRASLFRLLFDAVVAEDVPIETGRTVCACSIARGGRRLDFSDGSSAGPFDLVVDALGWSSPLAPQVGRPLAYGALWASLDWPDEDAFDINALQQRYRAASVMAGVLPIGRVEGREKPQTAFFWSLRADDLERWTTAGLDPWKDEVRALWPETEPFLSQITDAGQLTFAQYAHRTVRRPVKEGLVHLGDSWRSASPQLGQGANMALLDAYALASALRTQTDLAAALQGFLRLRQQHVWLYQMLSAAFTPVYQSDSRVLPWIRDQIVGPLAGRWPANVIQAAMVCGFIGDPLGRLGVKTPEAKMLRVAA